MSACCFCFGKNKNKIEDEEVSLKKTYSEHYQSLIKEYDSSAKSLEASKPESETNLENATDSSSNSVIPDRKGSTNSNLLNLYLPSKEEFCPCSELVLSKYSNFEMLLELEANSDWEMKIDKPFACIMIRTGTPNAPDIPIMKALFDMEIDAEPEDMYDVIYNPIIRKGWDNSIGAYNEIIRPSDDVIHYYMLNKAPWPFKDRDFTEIRYIRRRVNGDMEIYFSALGHQDYPEVKEKAIRGETIIGGQIFRKRISPITGLPTLMVTSICQADMKGEVPKKALKVTLPSSVLKWYRSLKKQLQAKVANE